MSGSDRGSLSTQDWDCSLHLHRHHCLQQLHWHHHGHHYDTELADQQQHKGLYYDSGRDYPDISRLAKPNLEGWHQWKEQGKGISGWLTMSLHSTGDESSCELWTLQTKSLNYAPFYVEYCRGMVWKVLRIIYFSFIRSAFHTWIIFSPEYMYCNLHYYASSSNLRQWR